MAVHVKKSRCVKCTSVPCVYILHNVRAQTIEMNKDEEKLDGIWYIRRQWRWCRAERAVRSLRR